MRLQTGEASAMKKSPYPGASYSPSLMPDGQSHLLLQIEQDILVVTIQAGLEK